MIYLHSRLVLQRNWQSVKRSNWLLVLLEILIQFLGLRQGCFREELQSTIDLSFNVSTKPATPGRRKLTN